MFSKDRKLELMRGLMWDYHYPPEHCLAVLEGEREYAGHYDEKKLFRKLLESYPWFTVLNIIPPERIRELLTKDVVQSLRFESLRKKYEFIRDRLPKALQRTGQGIQPDPTQS